MDKDLDLYKCSDFNVASVLKYFNCSLVRIERQNSKSFWFFENSKRTQELLEQYWQGKIRGNLVDFLSVQRFMKSSIKNN